MGKLHNNRGIKMSKYEIQGLTLVDEKVCTECEERCGIYRFETPLGNPIEIRYSRAPQLISMLLTGQEDLKMVLYRDRTIAEVVMTDMSLDEVFEKFGSEVEEIIARNDTLPEDIASKMQKAILN